MYIFVENNNTKNGKTKKKGRKKRELSGTRTRHFWPYGTTLNHNTTEAEYVAKGKCLFHETFAGKVIEPHQPS